MNRTAERGVALIAAIFLVVIIGAGVVLLSILSVRNSQQTTQNLLQIRAQLSVEAALEYGVQSLVQADNCNTYDPSNDVVLVIDAYPNFVIKLSCVQNNYVGPPSQIVSIMTLNTTAEWGSPDDADYVWAESEATIEL